MRSSSDPPVSTLPLHPNAAHLIEALLAQRDAGELMEAIVGAAQEHLGMEMTFLSQFVGAEQQLRVLAGDTEAFGVGPGGALPLSESYCARLVRGELPPVIGDAQQDPLVKDLAITAALGIGSYVGVPVRLAGGELYGTLCCVSHAPCGEVAERDVRFMRVLAAILADDLSRDPERSIARRSAGEQIAKALRAGGITMVFQPIVRLADGVIVGVEALARFDGLEPPRPPDGWFADAWEIGLGEPLELLAVRSALRAKDELPEGAYLAINVDPRTAVSDAFAELLEQHAGERRLLVELTEHASVDVYERLRATMDRLRPSNVRFAIDDVGAGYSGLNHMVQVGPDVIKLDRFLTVSLEDDPARQAVVAAAAAFSQATHIRLIAEGIEERDQLDALRSRGVRYGQGYLLGAPAPLQALT